MSTLPSIPFKSIDSVRVAVDAPVSTDLMTDICVDLNYLYAGINNANGKSIAVFATPGNFNWTPPPGITNIWVEEIGGGGAGYNGGSASVGGNGAYQIYEIAGLTGAAINLQVGAGGAVAGGGGTGGNGTATWFGAYNQNVADYGRAGTASTPGVNGTPATGSHYIGSNGPAGAFGLTYGNGGISGGSPTPGQGGCIIIHY